MVAARRILIVEDEHIVQLHLRMILQDLGYEITGIAGSSAEALASADSRPPHLVLMDVRLTGRPDGIETARELRARHDLDVVFLTAYADERTVGRAQAVGAVGYLVKPFSKPQLRAALSTAFARHAEPVSRRPAPGAGAVRRAFGAGTRMAIFSHDTLGLGHLQRNLNLAWALTSRHPDLSILLLTGSAAQHRYALPPGVDTVKLPAVRKVASERYEARTLRLSDERVLELRTDLTLRVIRGFDPHVLLVDHAPLGMGGELLPTLEWLERERPNCVRIAGLRDVIDSPEIVARQRIAEALDEHYDQVVVYGMPEVYDTASAYGFSSQLRARTSYCGYVGRFRPEGVEPLPEMPATCGKPLVLVTIGGGDGAGEEVLGGWLRMLQAFRREIAFESLLLTGPFVEPDLLTRLRSERDGLPAQLIDFVPSTRPYQERADLVVCTGGYNTMVETASFASKALILPRQLHREEQRIRARRFQELGLVSTLDPRDVAPERLYAEVVRLLADPRKPLAEARARGALRLDGAQHFAELCSRLEVAS